MDKKCEALRANKGKSWSLCAFSPDDNKKYHQCNQPATKQVVNEYADLGGPRMVWLCDDCDKISLG